jgi:hypothetical protein
MKKGKNSNDISWDIDPVEEETIAHAEPEVAATPVEPEAPKKERRITKAASGFDMEGLMTDFPTATDLMRFVYDQTGIVLQLKGRANKVKYQVAMDCLNGIDPDPEFVGEENPYVDRTETIPVEPLRDLGPRDPMIDAAGPEVTRFATNTFPHPDPEWRAKDMKCQVIFRKYANNIITYEILGPIAQREVGVKINKFGQKQPEKIVWIDARTNEQIIRNSAGQLTPLGTRLKGFMQRQKVNKSNQWDTWIDREFIAGGAMIIDNPWSA